MLVLCALIEVYYKLKTFYGCISTCTKYILIHYMRMCMHICIEERKLNF